MAINKNGLSTRGKMAEELLADFKKNSGGIGIDYSDPRFKDSSGNIDQKLVESYANEMGDQKMGAHAETLARFMTEADLKYLISVPLKAIVRKSRTDGSAKYIVNRIKINVVSIENGTRVNVTGPQMVSDGYRVVVYDGVATKDLTDSVRESKCEYDLLSLMGTPDVVYVRLMRNGDRGEEIAWESAVTFVDVSPFLQGSGLDGMFKPIITDPEEGDILVFDGKEWINTQPKFEVDEDYINDLLNDRQYATEQWVMDMFSTIHFPSIPDISLDGYLKKDIADTLYQPIGNYLTPDSLVGYATEEWVINQNYLTDHQPIHALTLQGGAFTGKVYNPATGAATVNVPTHTSHLTNDSGFITESILQSSLSTKLSIADFEKLFKKVKIGEDEDGNDVFAIEAQLGLYSNDFISARGLNPWQNQGGFGLDIDALEAYLTTNKYVTQDWILQQNFQGSVTTYALTLNAGAFTPNVYNPTTAALTINIPQATSHLTNDSGFVTESSVESVVISKLNDWFELVDIGKNGNTVWAIKAKYGLFSNDFISARGLNPDGGGSGGGGVANVFPLTLQAGQFSGFTYEPGVEAKIGYIPTKTSHLTNDSGFVTSGSIELLVKEKFDELFEKEEDANSPGGYRIRAKFGLYSNYFVSARGINPDGSIGGGGSVGNVYPLTFEAGRFMGLTYEPGIEAKTVTIPTKTSHLDNDSGFVNSSNVSNLVLQQLSELFVKEEDPNSPEGYRIRAKFGLYSNYYVSARGINPGNTGAGGGVSELWRLDDVNLTNPSANQALVYNGAEWVNQTITFPELSEYAKKNWVLNQGFLTSETVVPVIEAKIEELFVKEPDGNGGFRIKAKFGLYSNEFISARGINSDGTSGGGVTLLGLLDDVTLTSPGIGQSLVYDGTQWVNMKAGLNTTELATYLTANNYVQKNWVETRGYATVSYVDAGLALKLDITTFEEFKAIWDDMFELETDANSPGGKRIKAKHGLYSNYYLSARGANGQGSSNINLMRDWPTADPGDNTGFALGANLGWELKERIDNLPTTSVNPYALTIQKNGVSLGTYDGSVAKTINISDVASAATLATHIDNSTIHVLSGEKTAWNNAVDNLAAHIADGTIHITAAERTAWNGAVTNFTAHAANNTIHITAAERTAWNAKLDASTFNTFKTGYDTWKGSVDAFIAEVDSMFRKEADASQTKGYRIKALFGLYTDEFLSARGINTQAASGGAFNLMREWTATENGNKQTQYALGANLGYELKGRLDNVRTLTVQKNGTAVGTFNPLGTANVTINISDVASAATLSSHTGNGTIHITAAERTAWNNAATNLSSIMGTDADNVINKWEEVVAFLDTYTEADTLANLLGNKVDKTVSVSAGTGLTGGGTLAQSRTLSLATSGVAAGTYTKVTVDVYGRVTAGASLAATDIPNLDWSKITSGKPSTLAGYGITDAYTQTEADDRYVNVTGDTMSGDLTVPRINIVGTQASTAYLTSDNVANVYFNIGGRSLFVINNSESAIRPGMAYPNTFSLGTSSVRWSNVYSVLGNFSGLITATSGVQIGSTADIGWYNYNSRIVAGNQIARGVNVGSLLVSNAWSDSTKVPTNGIYVKGALKIGEVTIEYDATAKGLKVSGGGLYSESYISARGLNDAGNGGNFGLLKDWPATQPDENGTDAVSAYLSWDLKARIEALEGGSALSVTTTGTGNTITSISKSGTVITATKDLAFMAHKRESVDPNNLLEIGVRESTSSANAPDTNGWHQYMSWGTSDAGYGAQFANRYSVEGDLYFRQKVNNTWKAWKTIVTSANIGSYAITAHQSLANYVTLDTTQSITGAKTFSTEKWILGSTESNEIKDVAYANGSIAQGLPTSSSYAIRRGIDFRWYGTHWVIGNVRAGDTSTLGFGVGLVNSDGKLDLGLRVTKDAVYAQSYIKNGGTSAQVLMADGSVQTHWKAADVTSATSDVGMITPLAMNNWVSGNFVKKSGDTMTGALNFANGTANLVGDDVYIGDCNVGGQLGIQGKLGNSGISFLKKDDAWGSNATRFSLTWDGTNMAASSTALFTNLNADLLDGIHASGFMRSVNVGGTGADTNDYVEAGSYRFGGSPLNAPGGSYGNLLVIRGVTADTLAQMYFKYTENRVWLRTGNITSYLTRDWREFAFTDSNVASATKLQTARSVWGQSFDGTEDVTGNLTLGGGNAIIGGNSVIILKDHGNNNVTLSASKGDLFLGYSYTDRIFFYSGNTAGTGTEKMRLLANGNLGIGLTSPTQKLDVLGNQRIGSTVSSSGGDVFLELWRGTNASWKILNQSGTLKLQSNYTTSAGDYFDCLTLAYNTGNVWIKGLITATSGVQIGSTADIGWYIDSSRIAAGLQVARGVNVGSLLVSNAWADRTKVPTNGIYVKGALKIGEVTIEYDSIAKGLKVSGGGLYSESYISARGLNGDSGGGVSMNRLDEWSDYTTAKAGYALSAKLGYDLYSNKADKSALSAYLTTATASSTYVKKSGDAMSGKLTINGSAASQPLVVRGIVGNDSAGGVSDLYLQYGANKPVYFGNAGGFMISADGSQYSGNAATATNADTLDGAHLANVNYCRDAINFQTVANTSTQITTEQFIEKLTDLGAFNYRHWTVKCTWNYAQNDIITDSGLGNIQLAGAIIEVWGGSGYMVKITTSPASTSSGVTNAIFVYRNHGAAYSPNWKRIANTSDNVASATNADKLDGVHNGEVTSKYWNTVGEAVADFNAVMNHNGIYPWNANIPNQPNSYGAMLQWANVNNPTAGTAQHWITQLASSTNDRLYYRTRTNGGNWTSWHTIAFTTDNVASATQLQTSRTIWGQSFNGTGNVDGLLTINYTGETGLALYRKEAGSGAFMRFYNANQTDNFFRVGMYGSGYFGIAYNGTDALSILTSGNVGIGTTSPSYLFHLNRTAYATKGQFNTTTNSYALNTASFICDSWVRTKNATGWYSETYGGGWYMSDSTWIRTYGDKSIYQNKGTLRTDGTLQVGNNGSTFIATNGGYVGINNSSPIHRLDVNGNIRTTADIMLTGGSFAWTLSPNGDYLNIQSSSDDAPAEDIFWINGKSGNFHAEGSFSTPKTTTTYLAGNQGNAIINSTATAGAYTMLAKMNSTNGYFTHGVYGKNYSLYYTAKTTVDAKTNSATYGVTLMGEDGHTTLNSLTVGPDSSPAFKSDANGNVLVGSGTMVTGGYWHFRRHVIIGGCNFFFTGNTAGTGQGMYMAQTTYSSKPALVVMGHDNKTYKTTVARFEYDGAVFVSAGLYSNGYVSARGQNTSSDTRLKQNLTPFEMRLRDIAGAPSVSFDWLDGSRDVGSVAQYWRGMNPSLTPEGRDGYLTLQYGKAALLASISIAKEVVDVKDRVAALEKEVNSLREENMNLKLELERR